MAMTTAGHVRRPTMPSATRLTDAWNARTAASVFGPKMPSAAML
jgi:hypothetical protein